MNKHFLFLFLIVFASCKTANMASTHSGVKYKTQQVIVASYKADCVGVGPQTCYLYKKNPEDEWIFIYSEIEGFSYEPGFEYVITVKTSADGNDYKDASNLKFELVEVISKTPDKEVSSPLNDTWGLIEMNGTKVDISQLARSPMIDINTLRKRFQGSTGCNSFSTTFSYTDEGSFIVDFPFAMTKMACPGNNIETSFLKALESVDAYQMEGINLLLLSQGEVVLRYRKVD